MVVGGDDDSLGIDPDGALLDFNLTVVFVCPKLHVLSTDLVLTEFLDDHRLLPLVVVPPFGIGLDVGVWPGGSDVPCLPGASSSDMPLVFGLMELGSWILEEGVDLLGLLKFGNIHELAVTSLDALANALLYEELVVLGGVALDVPSGWGDSMLEGTFHTGVFFAAVVPRGHRIASGLDVGALHFFDHCGDACLGREGDHPLDVRGTGLSFL